MRIVTGLADRMLSMVAPRATAAACCPPDPWLAECYCHNHSIYAKRCSYNCACKVFCGTCYNDFIAC